MSRAALPACLVLHGLGGGPYELGPLIAALEAAGHRVVAPVLPGHDGPGPIMPASAWADWLAAAEAAFETLATQAPGGRVAVLGFSTGGTLALALAERRPHPGPGPSADPGTPTPTPVDRLVLMAPFLAIRYTGRLPVSPERPLRWLARWLPDLPRRGPAARDPGARACARQADRFRTFSLAATVSALELIARAKADVAEVRVPTLILQGRRDSVVEPQGAAWLHAHLGSADRRLVWLDRSDHLVALDHDRDQLIAAVLAFLAEPLAPPAPATATPDRADAGSRASAAGGPVAGTRAPRGAPDS